MDKCRGGLPLQKTSFWLVKMPEMPLREDFEPSQNAPFWNAQLYVYERVSDLHVRPERTLHRQSCTQACYNG